MTPKPARETHALPNHRLGERPALAADSGAASVSCEVSEWGLVWVSVSDCLKRWLWQSGVGVTIGVPPVCSCASECYVEARASQLPWHVAVLAVGVDDCRRSCSVAGCDHTSECGVG